MNAIDPRIHQVLDGELRVDALPAELRDTTEAIRAAADLLAAPVPFRSLESLVMAEIHRPAPSLARRVTAWLIPCRPSCCHSVSGTPLPREACRSNIWA